MTTPSITRQGLFVKEVRKFNPSSHYDAKHVIGSLIGQSKSQPNDLGILSTWQEISKTQAPLYNIFNISKTVKYDMGQGFTWKRAVAIENPQILADYSDIDKPGLGGETFKVKFDQLFSAGITITNDIIHGTQLIVESEPYEENDGYVHTLKLANPTLDGYVDKRALAVGTRYCDIAQYRGTEYDTNAASNGHSIGVQDFFYKLGKAEGARTFSYTKEAWLQLQAGMESDPSLRVEEIWKFDPSSPAGKYLLGNPEASLSKILANVYKGDQKALVSDSMTRGWMFAGEKMALDRLYLDEAQHLMWSKGVAGKNEVDVFSANKGLFHQHRDYGNNISYTFAQFSLDWIIRKIESHMSQHMDFGTTTRLSLKVGSGLFDILSKAIQKEYASLGLGLVQADRFLEGTRFNLNFAVRFTGFFLKKYPQVLIGVEHEPALDQVMQSYSNPIVKDGQLLSSYTGLLYDLNDLDKGDNIIHIKDGVDNKLRYEMKQGNLSYKDRESTYFNTSPISGFSGTFYQRHGGILLQDPTKSLMFEMINPYV